MTAVAFAKATKTVMARPDISPAAKLFYFAVVDQMRSREWVEIGETGIGTMTGLKHQVIISARAEVVETGLLLVDNTAPKGAENRRGSGKKCIYRLPGTSLRSGQVDPAKPVRNADSSRTSTSLGSGQVPKRNQSGNRTPTCPESGLEPVRNADTSKTKTSCKTIPAARSARKPDPIWDTICELFALKPVTKTEKSRIGKVVCDLKAKGATPAGIRERYARAKAEWTDGRNGRAKMFGPEAITKNWDQLGAAEPDAFEEAYREAADG